MPTTKQDLGLRPGFTSNHDDTLAGVNRVAKALCMYYHDYTSEAPLGFCDCKYDAANVMALVRNLRQGDTHGQKHGEQTGCPELRTVMVLLNNITSDEFDDIMERTD